MKNTKYILFLFSALLFTCSNNKSKENFVKIIPISHSTLIIEHEEQVIYVDPIGDFETFENQKTPTLVLITDIHSDHFSNNTLLKIVNPETKIVAPKAVANQLDPTLTPQMQILNNGDTIILNHTHIEAIPMYHLREEAKAFHPKGRGNGYIINLGEQRIYISGDTEDTPEMRALKDIDIAFVCMNLPWTMSVEKAAEAVLEFKPKAVYPYHYKGTNGESDLKHFETLINKGNKSIKVYLEDWY